MNICKYCGREIKRKSDLTKHERRCELNPNREPIHHIIYPKIDYICKYCNKVFPNKNSGIQHEIRCSKNPNKLPPPVGNGLALVKYNKTVGPWNKGKTKEIDNRIKFNGSIIHVELDEYVYEYHNNQEINKWILYIKSLDPTIIPKYDIAQYTISGYPVISGAKDIFGEKYMSPMEHKYIASYLIGRNALHIPAHHLNRIKTDNRWENIIVFDSVESHSRFHATKYAYLIYNEDTHIFSCEYRNNFILTEEGEINMAFNNNNIQGSGNAPKDPTYYSKLRINHADNGTSVSFSYWKFLLRVSISEYKDNKSNDLASCVLSPFKARLFAEAIERVLDTEEDAIFGVDTGIGETRGFIAVGKDMGKPFLFIGKVASNGTYENSQRFDFNYDYNYLLKVHNIDNLKCQKIYDNTIELKVLRDVCVDYARAAAGALAAATWEVGKYEVGRLTGVVNRIADKVGVERAYQPSNNYSNKPSNSSFFSKSSEAESLSEELDLD